MATRGAILPCNTLVDVSSSVLEALDLTSLSRRRCTALAGLLNTHVLNRRKRKLRAHLATKEAMQIRADTISTLCVDSVALSAAGLEKRSALGSVTCKKNRSEINVSSRSNRRRSL